MVFKLPAPAGVAATVRTAREARGLTQRQLAGMVGRSQDHISKIERGFGFAQPRVLDAIALQLGYRWALIPLEPDDGQEA